MIGVGLGSPNGGAVNQATFVMTDPNSTVQIQGGTLMGGSPDEPAPLKAEALMTYRNDTTHEFITVIRVVEDEGGDVIFHVLGNPAMAQGMGAWTENIWHSWCKGCEITAIPYTAALPPVEWK